MRGPMTGRSRLWLLATGVVLALGLTSSPMTGQTRVTSPAAPHRSAAPVSSSPVAASLLPGGGLPYPDGCVAFDLSPDRCAYITRWAAHDVGADPAATLAFVLLGDPSCPDDDPGCGVARTMQFVVRVRMIGAEGPLGDASVFCGIGSGGSYLCTDEPVIGTHTVMTNGYHDLPCPRRGPTPGCATPVPTARPRTVVAAEPLRIAALSIPIDHAGAYEIPVGEATLPNGILSEATFDLADASPPPAELLVGPDGIGLRLQSLEDDGRPFDDAYEHGWRRGLERVRVSLVFEVEAFTPGATLEIIDLAVR